MCFADKPDGQVSGSDGPEMVDLPIDEQDTNLVGRYLNVARNNRQEVVRNEEKMLKKIQNGVICAEFIPATVFECWEALIVKKIIVQKSWKNAEKNSTMVYSVQNLFQSAYSNFEMLRCADYTKKKRVRNPGKMLKKIQPEA